MNKNTNPRKIPKTQQDVDRAYEKGKLDGIKFACDVFMYTLINNLGVDEEFVSKFNEKYKYNVDSVINGYISLDNIEDCLKREYDCEMDIR